MTDRCNSFLENKLRTLPGKTCVFGTYFAPLLPAERRAVGPAAADRTPRFQEAGTMDFNQVSVIRTVKRLSEASGYLQLGLTKRALACLEGLEAPGPLGAAVEVLRGEAARQERRFDDAATSFEAAARMLPTPSNKPLWLAVSNFHRQAGNLPRAIQTLAHARGALPPRAKPNTN